MLAKALQSAALATQPLYIEDVFSTYLYTGNGSTQTITNGIDLAGEGGLVWIKDRSQGTGYHHILQDTARGASWCLFSNLTNAESQDSAGTGFVFNSNGFYIGSSNVKINGTDNYVSWTFRKAPKFFDVVTYTGNGTAGRTVAHNLGSVPGMIIVKETTNINNWIVYHRSISPAQILLLEDTGSAINAAAYWNSTAATSTEFTLGSQNQVNGSGRTYVAYLFAHDAGGFGDDGTENVISCGSYTGTGAAGNFVSVGYEPQLVLIKRSDASQDWFLFDNMRGLATGTGGDFYLNPNLADAEGASGTYVAANATGFTLEGTTTGFNASGGTYIYIAIRRGPMKTPTTGTEVYNAIARTGTYATANVSGVGFPPDLVIPQGRNAINNRAWWFDRLRGVNIALSSSLTNGDITRTDELMSFNMDGFTLGADSGGDVNASPYNYINWNFRRAPGFFDVVCYTGTGSATTVAHNLGVVPELIIVKKRSATDDWAVYANNDNTDFLLLNTTAATADDNTYWNDTSPTASVFTVGTNADVNTSAATYVAYLFATLPGVSKVGSYTGNGTSQTIDCGFTTGARFVLIKRTDNTGDWYVWDSARGIVAGNDPHLSLNTTAAEVTTDDSVDADTSGFIVNQDAATNVNVNSATYIFLAIA